jgi:hypothetical protein
MKLNVLAVLFVVSSALAAPTGPPPGITPVHYVSPDGANVPPFTTWESAANSIQSAVDAASAGDMVLVGDGTYQEAAIKVHKSIMVKSANGPATAIVDGSGTHRCFHLANFSCTISGFTIRNGYYGYSDGAGVCCSGDSPVVTNCVITSNRAYEWARNGGGMYKGTAIDCSFVGNKARNGGGMAEGTAINCLFFGNTTPQGNGGGMYNGTAINCLFKGNSSRRDGAGMNSYLGGGEAINCTFVDNVSRQQGGGMAFGRAINCIAINNSAVYSRSVPNFAYTSTSSSCAPELAHGVDGNITNAPMFVDPDNEDYRLLAISPCIDAGSNGVVIASIDLDGNERIVDGDLDGTATVDMGAYEFNVQEIPVDIMVSTINLGSKGRTPVAVITTEDFDAMSIDPASVRFAGASPVKHSMEDVDGDGDIDLKLHFMTVDLDIDPATGEVTLMGQTLDGVLVVGMDAVKVVPSKK